MAVADTREVVSDSVQNRERRGFVLFTWLVFILGLFKDELALKAQDSHKAILNWTHAAFSFVLGHYVALAGDGFRCLAECSGVCGPHCLSLTWPPLALGVQLLLEAWLLLLRPLAPEPHPSSLVN